MTSYPIRNRLPEITCPTLVVHGAEDRLVPLVGLLQRFDRKLAAGGEWGCISIVEVVMRPPEVFVRPLAHEEAFALKRKAKQAKHFATRERAAILLASNVGNSVRRSRRCG